jgi:hypothetical protein
MTETVIKAIAIPVTMAMFAIAARVMHLRPELITSFFSQTSNAQQVKLNRSDLEARANRCRTPLDIAAMNDKQLNDFVFACEKGNQ